MSEVMAIANSWPFWALCGVLVAVVVFQAIWFVRLSTKEAIRIGYDTKKLRTAIGNGMIVAIGPGLSSIVVMFSMMTALGGPITWQRLSVVGAATTEMTAATIGANAVGFDLGDPSFTVTAFTMCLLIMALNGCGWMLMSTLFTGSMDKVRIKLSGGNPAWLALLSSGATIGLFSNMSAGRVLMGSGPLAAVAVGFLAQVLLDQVVSPRLPKVRSFALGISVILGIIAGQIASPV